MKVLITGATKGLGWAIAEMFASAGAEIVLTARSESDLLAALQKLRKAFPKGNFLLFSADLGRAEEVARLAGFIREQWGAVDVLVNNAGLFRPASFLTEADENICRHLDVNVLGPYRLSKALLPAMIERRQGHIFNICSVASRQPFPDCTAYTVSKFAVLGLTRSLREELKDKGIRVTAVLPGATYTDSWTGSEVDPARLMSANDVARAILGAYQLSPASVVEEIVLRPQLGDL